MEVDGRVSERWTGPHTLVLNASHEVLGAVPLGRALMLVLSGKAEVLVSDGEIRTISRSFPRAVVVRLTRYVHVPHGRPVILTRRTLEMRDNGECQYCLARGESVDHVLPRSRGGLNVWENVVLACRKCNNRKGAKTLNEIGWTLARRPSAPVGRKLLIPMLHPAWRGFINSENAHII